MGTVKDSRVPVWDTGLVEALDPPRDMTGFGFRICATEAGHGCPIRKDRNQFLANAKRILVDQRVHGPKDLRRGPVVLHHQDGAGSRESLIEIRQEAAVRAAPGIDGLVGISHHEEVAVVIAQHPHQVVLWLVDILKFIHHDVFQPLLPLQPGLGMLRKDVKREQKQIVVVQAEALFLLIQIPVEQDIRQRHGGVVFLFELVQRQIDQIQIVIRPFFQFLDFKHVPRMAEGHIAQGQAPLLVDDLQHGVDVRIVQDEKALGIAHGVAVLLKYRYAETVERAYVARILIADQVVDAAAHLVGSLVGKGDAQDVPGQDAQFLYQIGKAPGEGTGLAAAGAGQHAYESLGLRHRLFLGLVQALQNILHSVTSRLVSLFSV